MTGKREPTQAMPPADEHDEKRRAMQPTDREHQRSPKKDDEDFGGTMGTGGQSIMGYEGPEQPHDDEDESGDNPNAADPE